jgi:hypothetical protein
MSRVRDWYLTLRAANLPTVWADVLLGAGLVQSASGTLHWPLLAVGTGVSLLYLGGMAMNDAVDAAFDRGNASTRPVAAGRVSPRLAMLVASVLLFAGFSAVAVAEAGQHASRFTMEAAAVLVVLILLYQWTHRRSIVLAAVFMALCRASIPIIVSLTLRGWVADQIWVAALAIGCWTIGITLLGRGERGGERMVPSGILWLLAAALACIPMAATSGDLTGVTLGLLIVWVAWVPTVYRRYAAGQQGQAVCWAIAGLAVLDSALLLSAGHAGFAAAALVCAAAALGGQQLGGGS